MAAGPRGRTGTRRPAASRSGVEFAGRSVHGARPDRRARARQLVERRARRLAPRPRLALALRARVRGGPRRAVQDRRQPERQQLADDLLLAQPAYLLEDRARQLELDGPHVLKAKL